MSSSGSHKEFSNHGNRVSAEQGSTGSIEDPRFHGQRVSGNNVKTGSLDDQRPYGMLWLDSYFQEALLPNGSSHKVLAKIDDLLAQRMRKKFDNPERKQMLLMLVGEEFRKEYFTEEEYLPNRLEPPQMRSEERKKLLVDARNWLQKEVSVVTTEVGCERPYTATENSAPPCQEMQEFLQVLKFMAVKNMDRHLFIKEREMVEALQQMEWQQSEVREVQRKVKERTRLRKENNRVFGTANGLQSILRKSSVASEMAPGTAMSQVSMATSTSSRTTANIKGALYGASQDPPVFWGMQSNLLGTSVVAVLKRDPRRFGEVAVQLRGRQLPASLRSYMWMDVLLRRERAKINDVNVEKVVREKFGKSVARGMSELRIKRATHCPISGLIDNAVIELYDRSPGLRMSLEDDVHMKEATKALNVLYSYDRSYEPYLVYWLYPIQVAFQDAAGQSEHVYELAMYLDLLNKGCFPTWPAVFAVAERTMARLAEQDKDLSDLLETRCQVHPDINAKDFLVQMIHHEQAEAKLLLSKNSGSRSSGRESREDLLADPRIFLRKWVGEGFVSVLDNQAAVLVWDQAFLQGWLPRVLEDFCLALLLLLRHKFEEAADYDDMKRVFLREPCKLYTADIQKAWVHIQTAGALAEVPAMNRQRPKPREPTPTPPPPRIAAPVMSSRSVPPEPNVKPLNPVGIKNFSLKIVLPAEVMYKESWLVDFRPSNVRLMTSVYFGSVKLRARHSSALPLSAGPTVTDRFGGKVHTLRFPGERVLFNDLDPSNYDVEQEMGGYPYAVVRVDYNHEDKPGGQRLSAPVTLGWARLRLYRHQEDVAGTGAGTGAGAGAGSGTTLSARDTWLVAGGQSYCTVFGGTMAQAMASSRPNTPADGQQGLLGKGSELGAFVFDPRDEPQTPAGTTPRVTPQPSPVGQPAPMAVQSRVVPPPRPPSDHRPGLMDSFHIYVDAVKNIPDNATITKITGRLINVGEMSNLPDLFALPELDSPARNPRYNYRYLVNEDHVAADVAMVIFLRVYTVDKDTRQLSVIGSCFLEVFDKDAAKLRVGGHRRVMRAGMPDTSKGLKAVTQVALDFDPRVPAASIYFRLLPVQQKEQDAPVVLDDAEYTFWDKAPNESEERAADSFASDPIFPKTTRDMAEFLQHLDEQASEEPQEDPGADILAWMTQRLDARKQLSGNTAAGNLALERMLRYRIEKGLRAHIMRAYGLPEGMYIGCFAQIYPGNQAKQLPVTDAGYGKDEKFIATKHDYQNLQKSPRWLDPEKELHPHLDDNSCVLVQLFGLDIKYEAAAGHEEPGRLTDARGAPLHLGVDNIIGWTALSLFSGDYVNQGEHHLPVFKGKPNEELLQAFSDKPVGAAIQDHTWSGDTAFESASLVINLWDGHFNEPELLEGLKRSDVLLDAMGSREPYLKAEKDTKGQKMGHFVLSALTAEEQQEGQGSDVYRKEEQLFTKLVEETFYNLMESTLMEAGYGPL